MIPAMSRPSLAALTATRASCSAVATPAETPSTVAGRPHHLGYLRCLVVDDGDDDGERRAAR